MAVHRVLVPPPKHVVPRRYDTTTLAGSALLSSVTHTPRRRRRLQARPAHVPRTHSAAQRVASTGPAWRLAGAEAGGDGRRSRSPCVCAVGQREAKCDACTRMTCRGTHTGCSLPVKRHDDRIAMQREGMRCTLRVGLLHTFCTRCAAQNHPTPSAGSVAYVGAGRAAAVIGKPDETRHAGRQCRCDRL